MGTITIFIKGLAVYIDFNINATNFDMRISKEEAERLLLQSRYLPFEIMCKEYGEDEDWVGLTPDDLDEDTMLLDKDYQTFEIWLNRGKINPDFNYSTVLWKDKAYECREIADPDNPGFDLTVAPEELGEVLRDEFGQDFEGCTLDKQILFYASKNEMLLTDKQLYGLAV